MPAAGQFRIESGRIAHQEALRPVAQRQIDERGVFAAHRQEVRDHAEDVAPRPRPRLFDQADHLTDPAAQALVAALQSLQQFDAARQAAALLPQLRHRLSRLVVQLPQALALLFLLRQRLPRVDQLPLQLRLCLGQFLQLHVERRQILGGLGGLQT